ncbi:hypothetical protein T4E_6044 [Trichinella pseudospiralis]|uniref:Uncharacterized protein n=1 Tax=Trichinella pseudospiralis TaxID=6337 RepID=A0A0V0YG83_TRIPS|nr:hypothetical protein T4E_6044 [Trichinella pseudospiralis]
MLILQSSGAERRRSPLGPARFLNWLSDGYRPRDRLGHLLNRLPILGHVSAWPWLAIGQRTSCFLVMVAQCSFFTIPRFVRTCL